MIFLWRLRMSRIIVSINWWWWNFVVCVLMASWNRDASELHYWPLWGEPTGPMNSPHRGLVIRSNTEFPCYQHGQPVEQTIKLHHQPHDCLTVYWKRKSKKTSKLRVTGLCEGNSPVTGDFPAHRASNAEKVSIWWRHHAVSINLLTKILSNGW